MRTQPYFHDKIMALTVLPLIPHAVTPNMVTLVRFLLTPLVTWCIILENYSVAIPLFIATAFTDVIDGSLARMRNKVTEWGTIYDPVADKLLIGCAIAVLVIKYVHPYIAGAIVLMESVFLVGGFFKKRKGIIQSPSWFGKMKMLFQSLGVTLMLVGIAADSELFVYTSMMSFVISIVLGFLNVIRYGIQLAN